MADPISFDPFLGWVDITDPNNIPVDARVIGADDLLRYENFAVAAKDRLNELSTTATDDGLAALVANEESATGEAFRAATALTATPGALLDSSRTVVQGDSLTESFDSNTLPLFRSSWFHTAHTLSSGQIRLTENAAHGGYNSNQLVALFDTEVLTFDPTLVIVMPGRNDGQSLGYPSEMINYVTDIHAKCKAGGIGFVLVNTVPQGQDAIGTPVANTPTIRTGGALPAGTYRYRVTAGIGAPGGAMIGETLPSNIVSATTVNGTSQLKVHWAHVPGANWYRVYRETSDGSGVYGLIKEIASSNSPGFSVGKYWFDAGAITPGATNPPAVNTTALATSQNLNRARINAWLSHYAAKEGIPLVDVYSKLVDPATGKYKLGLTYDGTHPNGAGNKIIGQAVWDALKPLVKPAPVMATKSTLDTLNLYADGTLIGGDANYATGFTRSTIPSDDTANQQIGHAARAGFTGLTQRHELTAAGYGIVDSPAITTGFTAGDRILISARVEVTTAADCASAELNIIDNASATMAGWRWVEQDHAPSTVSLEVVIPIGATSFKFRSIMVGKGAMYLGELTAYNLTTNTWLT